MRRLGTVIALGLVTIGLCLVVPAPSGAHTPVHVQRASTAATGSTRPYEVYWDQNEQEDVLSQPSGTQGQLIPPWDANGQLCVFPGRSGRFVTGYNPTDPSLPGGNQPVMQPPVGEAVWNHDGSFSGQTIYVGGTFKLPGQTVGGDIPPDPSGMFNNNGTFTGCAFNSEGDLFATDLGTAQGQFPPPDNGRLIEWFGPSYRSYCIVYGPDRGGVGVHHVDGAGGLRQPGDIAVAPDGDVLVPVTGPLSAPLDGRVLRFSGLPRSASDCGASGVFPRRFLHINTFIQGRPGLLFPQSIAFDAMCQCWGVASTIGDPAIAWFDLQGRWLPKMGLVPGESLLQIGEPNGYNPFGIAFAPDGTAYFVDIHIICTAPLQNCGPQDNAGRVMVVTFTNGRPDTPVPIATGLNFPTSVTVCVPGRQTCPMPVSGGVARRTGTSG